MRMNFVSSATKDNAHDVIEGIISSLIPFDDLERHHIQETLTWIQSGAQIFRLQKPDIPPKHLVSYFVLFDERAKKVLLVDHKKAQLWLPAGGHVEPDEYPQNTVRRECLEELSAPADFWHESPLFLTSTMTVGLTAGHIDVSLWYILKGDQQVSYSFDQGEFNSIHWFDWNEIPYDKADPHLERFIQKLKSTPSKRPT